MVTNVNLTWPCLRPHQDVVAAESLVLATIQRVFALLDQDRPPAVERGERRLSTPFGQGQGQGQVPGAGRDALAAQLPPHLPRA
jgi:hypothetical protein